MSTMKMRGGLVVLGGGVSGLTAAFAGAAAAPSVRLVEARAKTGGWFCSEKRDSDTILERGPHSFRPVGPSGAAVVRLLEELGLEKEAVPTSASAKARYIWHNGKLRCMPSSVAGLLREPLTRPLPFLGLREALLVPKGSGEDESVYDFFARRFSPYVAETFADALLQGIFAGDIRRLSVQACLPLLPGLESQYGSIVRGMLRRAFGSGSLPDPLGEIALEDAVKTAEGQALVKATGVSFPGGLSRLTRELESQVFGASNPHCELKSGAEIVKISLNGDVELSSGEVLERGADGHVISSLPFRALVKVLPEGTGGELRKLAQETPFSSVGVVNFVWDDMSQLPVPGFGHLVPTSQMERVIGMIYDSEVFPSQFAKGTSGLTVMMGGMQFPEVARFSEQELVDLAQEKVREHLGIERAPDATRAWVLSDCIPQYTLGHKDKVARARAQLATELPFLRVTGNNYDGVGIADTVRSARRMVREICESDSSV
ncbi:Protoporphyrinogen oxidase [Hondaea fermentalgiana]|uniref:Protoporphyrinogen oxidase n=1 Tax=Hondaea fermentalgiana TaxID=2315210 RepID=A0A2R5GS63_9STRA|nr:Protoporphyrinogen oxidase [Hondaea fermentalgiana]|eukprot:GBG33726.1 Protoporphyrinogen oxidase [Hondaea fermentalgiana]